MYRRSRVRPSKASSAMGAIVGVIFIIIGVTVAIPAVGMFGIFWTLMAVVITGINVYNVFSERGFSQYEIDVEVKESPQEKRESFDERLRKLEKLKNEELITREEYEAKRREILNEKW